MANNLGLTKRKRPVSKRYAQNLYHLAPIDLTWGFWNLFVYGSHQFSQTPTVVSLWTLHCHFVVCCQQRKFVQGLKSPVCALPCCKQLHIWYMDPNSHWCIPEPIILTNRRRITNGSVGRSLPAWTASGSVSWPDCRQSPRSQPRTARMRWICGSWQTTVIYPAREANKTI